MVDVPTIEMSSYEARKKFLEYRAACRERQLDEDKAIMAAYKALSQGKKVLHIGQAMEQAGVDYKGQPQLAIVRADSHNCYFKSFQWWKDIGSVDTASDGEMRGGHVFASTRHAFDDKRRTRQRVVIPQQVFPSLTKRNLYLEAKVPMIPPKFRPKGSLENYCILWDVKWEQSAPLDPLLLAPLPDSPMMYAIVAMWDLTPLERAIMSGGRVV